MEEVKALLKKRRALKIPPPHRMGVDRIIRRFGVSEDDFFDLSTEDDKWELLDGTLIVHSPASRRHQEIASFLNWLLRGYVEQQKLGVVYYNPMVARLEEGKNVEPDMFFLRRALIRKIQDLYVDTPPDLVIEVTAKRRRTYDFGEKLEAYRRAKVTEIWIVDWERGQVNQYVRKGSGYTEKILTEGKLVSKAVKGFWIDVGWLWQRSLPDGFKALKKILGKRRR